MILKPLIVCVTALGLFPLAAHAQSCGSAKEPCEIESGTYHVRLPADGTVPKGIVIHLHGGGGKGAGLLKSGIAAQATQRGYLFLAPNGIHPNARFKHNWAVRARNSSYEKDDIAFLNDVANDAATRFNAPRDKTLLAGFSRGGSMAWDVACFAPDTARAYAPAAGAFWDDLPESCVGPVDLLHTHGWDDRTVPLEGRPLWDGRIAQGDVWESLAIMRRTNGCTNRQPSRSAVEGDRWWRHWEDCENARIDLLLHPGGHGVPKGWSAAVLDWFDARLAE